MLAAPFLAFDASTAPQAALGVLQRLERLSSETTHFATRDIIANRWSDLGWPTSLLQEQVHLLSELRSVSGERAAVLAALGHSDPKVRTLALGAVFVREDPSDLPAIARLMQDKTPTLPLLASSGKSGGLITLADLVSPQTVGEVAQAMIRFYLEAANRLFPGSPFGLQRTMPSAVFDAYWAERAGRDRCASWFLVKMRRATRRTSPPQPHYQDDVRRVLAEIDALPPIERAWTLLYVRADRAELDDVVPDNVVVTALQAVGPDALVKFIRQEPVADDPDLLASAQYSLSMTKFILAQAPKLLRRTDADSVVASAGLYRRFENNTRFVAAAARLRALTNVEPAAESLKQEIGRIPLQRMSGAADQAVLAFALWQMRGAGERSFLTEWFYSARPFSHSPDSLEFFLQKVEREARPDTPLLLAALVADPRFDQVGWFQLRQILEMVNKTLASPLVDQATIYRFSSDRDAGHQAIHASWRQLLRTHFGSR